MSDYGDDYSDYGEDFFYVEDEYMLADDLAEHAIGSPPPTAFDDEDAHLDWDRFDYFNDIEYASDGYDDGKFSPHKPEPGKTGEKRKRTGTKGHAKKKQRVSGSPRASREDSVIPIMQPVVWRAQQERDPKLQMWDGSTESYALLKDWRERSVDIPVWAAGSSELQEASSSKKSKNGAVSLLEPLSPDSEYDANDGEEVGIDPAALMAALQDKLSAAGGPMSGIDPQQLLGYALRMISNQDSGDDIAGELANALLQQGEGDEDEDEEEEEEGEDEEEGEVSTNLPVWLDNYRQPNQVDQATTPSSPKTGLHSRRPPTPPSSETNGSIHATQGIISQAKGKTTTVAKRNNLFLEAEGVSTRKRKADDDITDVEAKRPATGPSNSRATVNHTRVTSSTTAARSARPKR